ncbi:MAG: glycosyl hydrolase family 43 [Alphaproteobacteria bacterium]|nr:glycosyl hydrolase family 43 [Alphaproteobacteria bacterium]MBU1550320.1 glycosyl hydrolase family 43 [Alphaproteobacteria bacterium]MBU2337512.1 glycosyl hydrolase family 43 [Alphaproteobacteria bacterium]MBU2389829.1 glycosyl hydrolase family 43 [Alphaproteobacteria bacterium]
MLPKPKSDFWRVGIVPAPALELQDPAALAHVSSRITWLPDPGPWRYLADPFGIQRNGTTHVFVEAFDYRTKHAVIERHELGPDLQWQGSEVALARPFHLSYPFLIENDGDVFMVPESHKAGEIALYRARAFPHDWVRETALLPDTAGAEASLIYKDRMWWMFFTIVGPDARDQRELHIAFSESLTGPWKTHPQNPVLVDRAGARPGGTPFVDADGAVILPVQDCSRTYGGSLRFLRFGALTPEHVQLRHLAVDLTGDLASADHPDGFHTFAMCGDLTLIDVKRVERTHARHLVNLRRRLRKFGQRPSSSA